MFLESYVDPITDLFKWSWMQEISFGSILLKLLLTVFCAGIIGLQRATRRQAAGLRTYVLVCMGAAIAVMTNQFIFELSGNGDMARLGAQVISGIGFLGAGTILVTSRNQIRGLTTAAGLWASACMGLAIGAGFYTLALFGVIIIFFVLILFQKIEAFFTNRSTTYNLHVELNSRPDLKLLITHLRNKNIQIYSLEHNEAYAASGLSVYTITIYIKKTARKEFRNSTILIDDIANLAYVNFVEIIH